MSKYPSYISEKRRPVPTPKCIVENGQAHFGTFDKPFEKLNLIDCEKPCGKLMPDFMKKGRLTEWEAFEVHLDEGALVSAVYNTGPFGFSIFIWFDKRTGKIYKWRNIVPVKKAKVASQLVNDYCELKVKKSEYVIKNDLMNGKASAKGWSEGRSGRFEIDMSVERLAPPSNVSIPFGPNKPLYSEKDFFKATGYITVNGEKFVTNENSVSIIDDHKGYYPYLAHYDWLTTMGRCDIDGEKKYFAFNLTRNQTRTSFGWTAKVSRCLPSSSSARAAKPRRGECATSTAAWTSASRSRTPSICPCTSSSSTSTTPSPSARSTASSRTPTARNTSLTVCSA